MPPKQKGRKKKKAATLAPRFLLEKQYGNIGDLKIRPFDENNSSEAFRTEGSRYVVIKSFSEWNVYASIQYGLWSSTRTTLESLSQMYRTSPSDIYLFVSVAGTSHFQGIARMRSDVTFDSQFVLWEKLKYHGVFSIEWLVLKDVPNYILQTIRLNGQPKVPITTARDGQEIAYEDACAFLTLYEAVLTTQSLVQDFDYYKSLQLPLETKRLALMLSSDTNIGPRGLLGHPLLKQKEVYCLSDKSTLPGDGV